MLLAAIEWGKLLQVVWVSLVAGIGVTLIFSIAIYGGSKSADSRRGGRASAATAYGALTGVAMTLFLAGVVFGVAIILNK